jgi:glycosyltransferase involved in cell wall biosynthesis
MHIFGLASFSLISAFWVFHGIRVALGAAKLPKFKDTAPAQAQACPKLSLLFAAKDEEEKLPAALATMAEIDYPGLEIVAVDDRSQDATGRILDEYAAANANIRAVHVTELPKRWLGKPHALQKAYEASHGEWLLFTDADVQFERTTLRRAWAMAERLGVDHLTLFGDIEMRGFWEKTLITFFGLAFHLSSDPARVSNAKSRMYVGVGAFQLLRRSAYEAIGTHRKLAMEVVDDMKLGKLVKAGGFRSAVGLAQEFVAVRWQTGLGNLICGVTKNFFAAFGYNLAFATAAFCAMLMFNVAPFVGVIVAHGWIRLFCAIAIGVALCLHVGVDLVNRVSPLYALTHPIGAILFCYMIARSVVVTLWRGGVTWRGTFYALEELKKGVV